MTPTTGRRRRPGRRTPALVLAGTAVALVALVAVAVVGLRQRAEPATVTVMTRNLYLGADITRPLRATSGLAGTAALTAVGRADAELAAVVRRTDFGTRSRLLAAEVAAARPDLLALQEVALWRSGPLQLGHPGRPGADRVDVDFLTTLRAALEARGAGYDVVRAQPASDVEAPAFSGSAARPGDGRDLRLTVSDVLLVRQGSPVRVEASGSGRYRARLEVSAAGLPFAFVRGYAWADVRVGDRPLRFVATHLESQRGSLARAQAAELLAGPAAVSSRPVVIGCDCNSDPTNPTAGYALLTADGWSDAWVQAGATGPAATAGLGERLTDPDASALTRRLDLVLSHGTSAVPVRALTATRTGVDPADRDPATGLWPSDHAGVVATLRLG